MRVPQPSKARGSLLWIRKAIAAGTLDKAILKRTRGRAIEWRSPLADDEFAEYRDADFLSKVGQGVLAPTLSEFWPNRGPQWDALGLVDGKGALLVEAKAHVRELCSTGTKAEGRSRSVIEKRLADLADRLGARLDHASWSSHFYQIANRLAHLQFLHDNNVAAWLVLVNFVGDREMGGPTSEAEWRAAYRVAWHVMGLSPRHPLARYCIELFPHVANLA